MTTAFAPEAEREACPHVAAEVTPPRAAICEGCGSNFNLRVCTACGHVGCCESQQAHNTAHFRQSGHPIIMSLPLEPKHFTWCYECKRYL